MKIKESTMLLAGIVFTLISGALLHFLYNWSNQNPIVGFISPVNESVWEHTKLLFFPVLFYTFFEILVLLKLDEHFLTARLLSLILSILLIPCLFFIYTGFVGKTLLLLDLAIFICSVLTVYILSRYLEVYMPNLELPYFVLAVIFLFLLILYFSFTFSPPDLPLFSPPSS